MPYLNSCQKFWKFSKTNLQQGDKINDTSIDSGKKSKHRFLQKAGNKHKHLISPLALNAWSLQVTKILRSMMNNLGIELKVTADLEALQANYKQK